MFLSQFLYKMDKSVKRKIFPVESQRRKKCCVDFHYTCSNDFCNASTQAVNGDIDPQLSQLGAEDTFTAQTISTNIQNAVQVIELPRLISKDVRVEGTEFLVDHFVVRKDVKHYFLTRFDRSHGLTAEFNQTLYASIETALLVHKYLKVDWKYIRIVDHELIIDGITVSSMPVPNYLGAVMFLFKLKSGEYVLHGGMLTYTPLLEEYKEFWNHTISKLYLDPALQWIGHSTKADYDLFIDILNVCRTFYSNNERTGLRGVIVCDFTAFEMDEYWFRIKVATSRLVYMDKKRADVLATIGNNSLLSVIVSEPNLAELHVISTENQPLDTRQVLIFLKKYLDNVPTFRHALLLRPRRDFKGMSHNVLWQYPLQIVEFRHPSMDNDIGRFVKFLSST